AHLPDEHRTQLRRSAARARLAPAHRQAPGLDACQLEARRRRDPLRRGQQRGSEEALSRRLETAQAVSAHRSPAEIVFRARECNAPALIVFRTLPFSRTTNPHL